VTPKVSDRAVLRLSRLLMDRVGLRPAGEGGIALKLALQARLEALGEADCEAYVARLEEPGGVELRALLPLVTVGKTEFFRDANQFRALREAVLPRAVTKARSEMRRVRIWSAGCATGEEAYSLAMALAELGVELQGADILGTDVNPQALELAEKGRFSARRVSGLSPAMLERYFMHKGEHYEVLTDLKARVRFAVHNLAAPGPFPAPFDGPPWDLILCRNVLIYFERMSMLKVLRSFHDCLAEGGILCLGYSESLFKVSSEFELVEVNGAFLYRRGAKKHKGTPTPTSLRKMEPLRRAEPPRKVVEPPRQIEPPRPAPEPASREVSGAPTVRTVSAEIAAVKEPLATANRLLEEGRFDAAAKLLEVALDAAPQNLALLLTHGNAMLTLGKQPQAREDFKRAREIEPLCAEAHLFLGIACAEGGAPQNEEALRELSQAIFLDPQLALAHYWIGRLAEQKGDPGAARRAYRNAIEACRKRKTAPSLLGIVPGVPSDVAMLSRAASYALAALEER
jgi:chemotaxis protein methyltransferase CheR